MREKAKERWEAVIGNPSNQPTIIDPSEGGTNFLVEGVRLIESYFTPQCIVDYIEGHKGDRESG